MTRNGKYKSYFVCHFFKCKTFIRPKIINIYFRKHGDGEEDGGPNKKLNSGDINLSGAVVSEVGSTNPVEDFERLLSDGGDLISGKNDINIKIVPVLIQTFLLQLLNNWKTS